MKTQEIKELKPSNRLISVKVTNNTNQIIDDVFIFDKNHSSISRFLKYENSTPNVQYKDVVEFINNGCDDYFHINRVQFHFNTDKQLKKQLNSRFFVCFKNAFGDEASFAYKLYIDKKQFLKNVSLNKISIPTKPNFNIKLEYLMPKQSAVVNLFL